MMGMDTINRRIAGSREPHLCIASRIEFGSTHDWIKGRHPVLLHFRMRRLVEMFVGPSNGLVGCRDLVLLRLPHLALNSTR